MPAITNAATTKVLGLLAADTGLPATVAAIAEQQSVPLPTMEASQVVAQQVAFETAERSVGVRYPAVYVYCAGIANLLKEKFRTFSGKAFMTVEVRASHDRLEGLAQEVPLYAAAVTDILDAKRGDWGSGMFYTGGYKVEFGPVKHGGRNFLQVAKITFEVEVSY